MLDSQEIRAQVLALLRRPGYQPLDQVGLSKALRLRPEDRKHLRAALTSLEDEGAIVRLRQDRYALPDTGTVTGKLEVHRNGNAHLLTADPGAPDVFIAAALMGIAMHGDQVLVQIGPAARRRGAEARVEGRVLKVLSRATSIVVGTLQRSPRQQWYVAPDDSRFSHNVYVTPGGRALPTPPQVGDKVVLQLDPWENSDQPPEGEITEVLGPAHAPGIDMLAIVRKYDLRPEFPSDVSREAQAIPERLTEHDLDGREDLRAQPCLTIDPDDARDFDDAIYVERLKGWTGRANGWRLFVHIADVSHYVAPGTALDREARRRGNSTYLVDRVVPMLPERLSNGICSLRPDVERLTFTAVIDFDSQGKIKSTRFARTAIRSAARLSYRQAYAILQGQTTMPPLPPTLQSGESRGQSTIAAGPDLPVDPAVAERVRIAWELASVLRHNRFDCGSLDLDFPEVKIWLDAEGRAARLEKVENDISHQLIEECMLAANEVVAREIKDKLIPTIYRIHEDPEQDRLLEFREFAAEHGFQAGDLTNRAEVQKLLSSIRGSAEEYAIKLQFLKSLKRAVYGTKPLGHYGLAKVNYTHFTSPIRRYADLLVHRSLEHIIRSGAPAKKAAAAATKRTGRAARQGSGTPVAANLEELAIHISQTERTSTEAERDSVTLKKLEFFQRQLASRQPQKFQAVVVDVRFFGLLVELPEILTSGMVPVNTLQDDYYTFDPARRCFTGRRTQRVVKVGDRLTVVVAKVDAHKRQMDFAAVELLTGAAHPAPSSRGRGKAAPHRQRDARPEERKKPEKSRAQERPRGRKSESQPAGRRQESPSRGAEVPGRRRNQEPRPPRSESKAPLARDFAAQSSSKRRRSGRPGPG